MPEGDAEEVKQAFAAVLKEARASAGLTQEELAERAGVYRTYPSLLERAKRQPTLDVVIRIGRALGVGPRELVRRTSEKLDS